MALQNSNSEQRKQELPFLPIESGEYQLEVSVLSHFFVCLFLITFSKVHLFQTGGPKYEETTFVLPHLLVLDNVVAFATR